MCLCVIYLPSNAEHALHRGLVRLEISGHTAALLLNILFFVSVFIQNMKPGSSTGNNSHFILGEGSDFRMFVNLLVEVHALPMRSGLLILEACYLMTIWHHLD